MQGVFVYEDVSYYFKDGAWYDSNHEPILPRQMKALNSLLLRDYNLSKASVQSLIAMSHAAQQQENYPLAVTFLREAWERASFSEKENITTQIVADYRIMGAPTSGVNFCKMASSECKGLLRYGPLLLEVGECFLDMGENEKAARWLQEAQSKSAGVDVTRLHDAIEQLL